MLARFNIFPSSVLSGRFQNIPHECRTCEFCHLEPDIVAHILCHCSAHSYLCERLLEPILSSFIGPSEGRVGFLLEDSSNVITNLVADFLVTVIKKVVACELLPGM